MWIAVNISKTKDRTKKNIYAKNERQINSNLPCKFGQFWRKLFFLGPKTPFLNARSAQMRYNIMWYEILRPTFFLGHCEAFISGWPLLKGGGESAYP